MLDIKKHIIQFYKSLYSIQEPIQVDLSSLNLPVLSDQQSQALEAPVSEDEIKAAVWRCDPSKAPGYDGFNIKFIKCMWDIIGKDIITFVQ